MMLDSLSPLTSLSPTLTINGRAYRRRYGKLQWTVVAAEGMIYRSWQPVKTTRKEPK